MCSALDRALSDAVAAEGNLERRLSVLAGAKTDVRDARAKLAQAKTAVRRAQRGLKRLAGVGMGAPAPKKSADDVIAAQRAADAKIGARLVAAVDTVRDYIDGKFPGGPSSVAYDDARALLVRHGFGAPIWSHQTDMEDRYVGACATPDCPHKGRTIYNSSGFCRACDDFCDYTFGLSWDSDSHEGLSPRSYIEAIELNLFHAVRAVKVAISIKYNIAVEE